MTTSVNTQELTNLLAATWKLRNGSTDEKMVSHCLKTSKYIQIGYDFIDCGNAKPSIESTMWYDDETEGPSANFDNFRAYNLRSNCPKTLTERFTGHSRDVYIIKQYNRGAENLKAFTTCYKGETPYSGGRLATAEEIKIIDAAIETIKTDYEKRLVSYWKRYSSKVHAYGYYANR